MEIKYGNNNDKIRAEYLWRENFKDSENEVNFYFNELYKKENFLLMEDEKKNIRASLHENPYEVIINKEKIASFYIVGVAVSSEYRGRGYMGELVRYSLKNAREKGVDFIFLSPVNSEIYKNYGFGYISSLEKYAIPLKDIPFEKIETAYRIEKVTEEKEIHGDLIDIYEKKMKESFAYLKRDENYFKRIFREIKNENGDIYIFYFENKPVGYISLYKRDNGLEIREFFGMDKRTILTMYAFIKTYKEYYSELIIKAPLNSNLNFYIHNQVSMEKSEFPFIMGRIINVKNIFEKLHIKTKELKIYVKDEILQENDGVYILNIDGSVTKKEKIESDIEIDIENFNHLIFGYFSIEEMVDLEKIKINDMGKLEEIKRIFSKQKTYIQEYQ